MAAGDPILGGPTRSEINTADTDVTIRECGSTMDELSVFEVRRGSKSCMGCGPVVIGCGSRLKYRGTVLCRALSLGMLRFCYHFFKVAYSTEIEEACFTRISIIFGAPLSQLHGCHSLLLHLQRDYVYWRPLRNLADGL